MSLTTWSDNGYRSKCSMVLWCPLCGLFTSEIYPKLVIISTQTAIIVFRRVFAERMHFGKHLQQKRENKCIMVKFLCSLRYNAIFVECPNCVGKKGHHSQSPSICDHHATVVASTHLNCFKPQPHDKKQQIPSIKHIARHGMLTRCTQNTSKVAHI